MYRVRFMHAQFENEPRNSHAILWAHSLGLPSLHDLPNTFWLSGASLPSPPARKLRLCFSHSAENLPPCVWVQGQAVAAQRKNKRNGKSPHTLGTVGVLVRAKGASVKTFRHCQSPLLSLCCAGEYCLGTGHGRRQGVGGKEFSHSLRLEGDLFLLFRPKREEFS